MKTPKEKAEEIWLKIFNKQFDIVGLGYGGHAVELCIIMVDEIIQHLEKLSIQESGTKLIDFGQVYWKEVKNELEKM